MASAKGMELETSALTLTDGGRELFSEAPVRFRFGEDLGGNAGHLRAQLRRELFVLGGGVTVNSRSGAPTPLSLRAQRVALERRERLLRAEGNVRLTHGASSVEARRVAALFAEDERTLRSVAARWEVSGELVPASGRGTPVQLGGYRLAADLDAAGKNVSQVELEGGEGRPARLVTAAPRGGERRLRAGRISARLEEGELHSAVATGGVELQEPAGGDGTLRSAEANQAEAAFGAGGALVAVTLTGDVRLSGPDLRATGQRAYVEQAGGRAELFGERGGVDAMAANERGELRAPHLVYTRATGVLHADGGVKAQLAAREGSAVAGVALGSEGGPIRVEAAEANWQEEPPTFSFAGQVRAWRGDNLLTAEQLRGNERNGELSASGGVRTLWVLGNEEGAAGQARRAADRGGGRDAPLPPRAGRAALRRRGARHAGEARADLPRRPRRARRRAAGPPHDLRRTGPSRRPRGRPPGDRGSRRLRPRGQDDHRRRRPGDARRQGARRGARAGSWSTTSPRAACACWPRSRRRREARRERRRPGPVDGRPAQGLRRPRGGPRRLGRDRLRRDRRPAGPERRRQDHHVLHGGRPGAARRGPCPPRRRGHHRAADVPARAARHQLPAAGAVGLPPHVGRGQPARDPRDPGPAARRAGAARRPAARGLRPRPACARPRAMRCRAASGGGSRSRAPWRSARPSSCSTSRLPASIQSRCSTSRASCATCASWASAS